MEFSGNKPVPKMPNIFFGRRLLIATKHGKEKVIAPLLENEIGVCCFVATNFDTDELGTFTGEIIRKDDPLTTLREKCLKAAAASKCDLVVASEGSFGPHPLYFFIPCNEEILMLVDIKNNMEIWAKEISTETNFNGSVVTDWPALKAFSERANFPSHALILRKSKDDYTEMVKGINDYTALEYQFNILQKKFGAVYVETDMRAMHNPLRMEVIKKAAIKLSNKLLSNCPECECPGFDISEIKSGLPCASCNFPTKSTAALIYSCNRCGHTVEKKFPNSKRTEDPMYCDVCNP
jgi:hypothetical protein